MSLFYSSRLKPSRRAVIKYNSTIIRVDESMCVLGVCVHVQAEVVGWRISYSKQHSTLVKPTQLTE